MVGIRLCESNAAVTVAKANIAAFRSAIGEPILVVDGDSAVRTLVGDCLSEIDYRTWYGR